MVPSLQTRRLGVACSHLGAEVAADRCHVDGLLLWRLNCCSHAERSSWAPCTTREFTVHQTTVVNHKSIQPVSVSDLWGNSALITMFTSDLLC